MRIMLAAWLLGAAGAASAVTVTGRFINVALDAGMSEWLAGDVFYNDSEIGDGLPLSSCYSNVYLANNASYLYLGLQLKAPSSITSNWTHEVYIDTDNNPSTGFNSGWMSGGYDRLVQYGAGGGVYSVYEFTGGANQAAWSWGFVDVIQYAFDQERIEWAIPRSALGGAVVPRVLFHTSGGDVSIETWAYFAESGAKNYQMADTPSFALQIQSARGSPQPAVGTYTNIYGTVLTNSVASPSPAGGTQYVSLGWTLVGNEPSSGAGTNFSMTATNNAVLTWLWQTNVQLTRAASGAGSVGGDGDGYYARGSAVNLSATPDAGYLFKGWSGDVPAGQTNDNPLALTMDRARNVTANFGAFNGRFTAPALDGSLVEWTPADVFYTDADIVDGEPLNSTYSAVYVANDHAYLYVGLQLKAPSSINSNWLHSLYIDTDQNPATGYNAGWMSSGYDRLVQYGGGGGTYSIYSFGGANQAEWSWNFADEIGFAYSGDVIEWAIPRSALGGSTAARLEFYTGGGSVTIETWAYHTEAQSRRYAFAATPGYTVTVASAKGTPTPSVGPHAYNYGTVLTNRIGEPSPANGTQFVNVGWTMSGHSPSSGSTTSFTVTVTNNATLTWLWQTNVQFAVATNGSGSVSGTTNGYYALGSTANLTATPAPGYAFAGWSGAVPGGQTNDNPLALTLDRTRSITANFAVDYGRFAAIAMDGLLNEWGAGDLFYDDSEIVDGAPAASTYSGVYVANDIDNLYIGLQLKAASSIFSNWTHELYIDSDNNPATGFNAGWMSGGYDLLVQYGSGGTVYSVYSFAGGTQVEWSWNFLGTIGYAFNGDAIEWSIPRSFLTGGNVLRLEFHVGAGDVTTETWAHHTEANAKLYTMAPTPLYTLQVISHRGTPSPSVGMHTNAYGSVLTNSVISPAAANGTQYVANGWAMTGNDPLSGGGTNFAMTVTNNAVLTWLWTTNVLFTRNAGANGSIAGDTNGYYAIGSPISVSAVPAGGYLFTGWSGDVPGGQTNDNPLALTLDRARTITANFGTHQGAYTTTIAIDGTLTDWSGIGAFYADSDISDGLPLSSSCSNIFIANDLANLYVGLQFKAPSSINSNWVYNLFIDTDMNPTTGFNGSGNWMANGYDRLIQYGANGGVYSVYSFSGASQGDWSWNFVGLINYAFDQSTAEWAIPLSSLGLASNQCKLEFQVTEGAVTVETWAHHTEANARVFTLGAPPPQSLQVVSAYGTGQPSVGTHTNAYGTEINCSIAAPAPANGTQYVAVGWSMAGNDPLSGSGTNFTMTLTNSATLTWLWQTNVQFSRTAGAHGAITGDSNGYYALNGAVSVTAVPDGGYSFSGWSGDVPGGQETDNPLNLTLDRARSIVANFSQNVGRFVNVSPDGSLAEWQVGDVFYSDDEIADGAPLSSTYSSISVANDDTYLYAGLQLKAPSSIDSNWVHELYIDSDMNPATGFNSGWMSGGYDRLIQYGSGGTVYSIYSFSGGTQSEWSWNFLGTINYGYNGDVIEWAIPRSLLGSGNIMRLEFHVVNGAVTIETWAHHTEANAKSYAFATPNNCPSGIPPLFVPSSDKTIEESQLLSFEVRANDPGCVPPDITVTGKPAAASFGTSPSGTNQVGTFTWTPSGGDVGTHLLRFTAEDDQGYTTSFVMRVYVASSGEQTNSAGVPLSQTNWAVEVTDIAIPVSGSVTVHWDAVSGIPYDVYTSPGPFGAGMSWTRAVSGQEAASGSEQTALSLGGRTNFVQVVPAGSAPTLNGVWGVIKPTVASGISMLSPPLQTDGSFLGQLGEELATVLPENTYANIMHAGDDPTWTTLRLNDSGVWVLDSGTADYTLDPGQAFFVQNPGGTVTPAISGPVGNTGGHTLTLEMGFNLVGVSEGKNLAASTAFESAAPVGNFDEELADQVVVLNANGSWRRLIRRPNGTWYDTANPNSSGNTTLTLTPGQAYYYIRRNSSAELDF